LIRHGEAGQYCVLGAWCMRGMQTPVEAVRSACMCASCRPPVVTVEDHVTVYIRLSEGLRCVYGVHIRIDTKSYTYAVVVLCPPTHYSCSAQSLHQTERR
jgi:hypothetical protein